MVPHSLYIHWPFCLSKCPYCDFNSHISTQIDPKQWEEAYKKELLFYQKNFHIGAIQTLFFGGGTPSLMPPSLVEAIITMIKNIFGLSDTIEISLEANPTSSESQKFKDYKNAGINRLSMGIQSLIDKDLKFLGRTHSSLEAIKAFESARSTFESVSFDIIYARQDQTLKEWKSELSDIVALAVDHLSLYQLTIEENTVFDRWYRFGKITVPSEEISTDMYNYTHEFLQNKGYEPYEVSNFAKNKKYCQHNLNYWRYKPYLGIGPGAHGRVYDRNGNIYATETQKSPKTYLIDPLKKQITPLSQKDQEMEYMLMGLRLQEGIDLSYFESVPLDTKKLQKYHEDGYLEWTNTHLKFLSKGRTFMNYILSDMYL